jgi:hypothetical protein
MSSLNFLSLVPAPLEVLSSTGKSLSTASGFFYKRDEKSIIFVTNWHVVTGRDPSTPHSSKTGAIPTVLRLKVHKNVGEGKISKSQKCHLDITINDASGNAPEWLEHPRYKFKVDLAIIKIDNDEEFKTNVQCHFLSEYKNFQEDFYPSVMDDIFVVGYPWGLTGGDPVLPLFKRGSIASEPLVDYGELPRFLIDCRTANGMSGAPVLCAHSGIWMPNGKMTSDSVIGTVENFAGVYSGRLRMKDFGEDTKVADRISEIGVVWKREALDEIVEHGVTGTKLDNL